MPRPVIGWDQFRRKDGTFREWLHTWHMLGGIPVSQSSQVVWQAVWNPRPWIFAEPPNGEALMAFYHMGYFKNAPEPWPTWKPGKRMLGPIYGTLLQGLSHDALQRHISQVRRQCLTDIDLIAHMGRHYTLFK